MPQRVVSRSLRNGFIRTSLAAPLTLFESATEAVRLGASFDNVRPIGDAVEQRLALFLHSCRDQEVVAVTKTEISGGRAELACASPNTLGLATERR